MRRLSSVPPFVFEVLIACALLGGGHPEDVKAQSVPDTARAHVSSYGWIAAGVGGTKRGVGSSVMIGVPVSTYVVAGGRYVSSKRFSLFETPPPVYVERLWEVGPLVGLGLQGRFGQVSLGSGIVVVGGRQKTLTSFEPPGLGCFLFCTGTRTYATRRFQTVGLPLDAQVFFTPSPYVGVGLHLYGTITPRENMRGVSLQLIVRVPT